MNRMSKDQFSTLVQKYASWPPAQVQQMIEQPDANVLRGLKVDQLKKILKELVQNGYPTLQYYGNKPYLIAALHNFLKSLNPEDNLFHYGYQVANPTYQAVAPPPPLPAATNYHPMPIPPIPPIPPFQGFPAMPIVHTAPFVHPAYPHQATLNRSFPSTNAQLKRQPAVNQTRHPSQLTKQELTIYNNLREIEGITGEEILAALNDCPANQKSVDSVLMMIIDRKQASAGPPVIAPQSKEQEDADLDRAILESEKERDHIQERKRKRVTTILEDPTLKILDASEFQKSVLLRGLPSQYHPNSTSSPPPSSSGYSSSSSVSVSNPSGTSSLPPLISEIMRKGCRVLRDISSMLDHHYEQKQEVDIIDLSTDDIQFVPGDNADDVDVYFPLRQAVIRLLLIEFDALKYYGEVCYAYLLYLSEQLDQTYSYHYNHNNTTTQTSSSSPGLHWYKKLPDSKQREIIQSLQQLHQDFSKGLFKLVKDGEGVPTLFRKNYLKPYFAYISHRLDQDGFEIVATDKQELVKFVNDVSEIEDDDDDYDEDYDD